MLRSMPDLPPSFSSEIAALRRLVELSSGSPAFAFALCNLPALRRDVIAQLSSPEVAMAVLPADTVDPVATARALIPVGHHGAVFVTGLETLLSEAHPDSAGHIARLNRSRERWRAAFPAQLMVFWLSEQALLRILREAPDFRAWISHELDFIEPITATTPQEQHAAPVSAEALSRAAAITARLSGNDDLPPMQRLSLIRELLRLAPASEEAAAMAEEGIRQSLQSLRQRTAKAEDHHAQRDLVIALDDVAASYLELGHSHAALRHYQEAHVIAERLAASDPANAEWQRDLSVSLEKLGDLAVAQGDLAGALRNFTESKTIRERLAASDPANAAWQRDLSVSLNFLGNVSVAQGNLDDAKRYYTEYKTIAERLVARSPANAAWQRDLSVSLNFLGNVYVAQGDLTGALRSFTESKTIAEHLAASDPANTAWQRDLSVSLIKLGDLAVSQGDLAGALRCFTESKTIAERLAASDPANASCQRDLFVSCWLIAMKIHESQGRLAEALALMEQCLAISERLAATDSTNVTWQKDVKVSRAHVARLREKVQAG
jgi:tetratricopeptide (TPR) repeat protein